jgi:parallel beta-helix repeat protein
MHQGCLTQMKMNTIAMLCLTVLVLCPIATTESGCLYSIAVHNPLTTDDYLPSDSWYMESLPIQIVNNSDFAIQAAANSWHGNGSVSEPYIIEALNITVTGGTPIQIVNTSVFFEVRGCLTVGGSTGIYLQNVTNAKVWNNTIQDAADCGVLFTESKQVLITNNTVHSTSSASSSGISSYSSEYSEISNNTIHTINGWGVLVDYSHNCSITQNRVHDCIRDGIGLRDSSENNITTNEISHAHMSGIKLGNSPRCLIEWNLVSHSFSDGISIEASADCIIQHNVLYESGAYSLDVAGASTDIISNTFYQSQLQGLRCQSDNNYATQNNFIENGLAFPSYPTYVSIIGANNTILGNYYDIWTWPDENEDGIVDPAYLYGSTIEQSDSEPHVRVFQTNLMHILTRPILIYPNDTLDGEKFWGPIDLKWGIASDTFGHNVTYNVSVSSNGGSSWTTIASDLIDTVLSWNSSLYAESAEYRFKISAQCIDGLVSEYTTNAEYEVKAHTLSIPTILTPNGGEAIVDGCVIAWVESVDSWGLQVRYDVYYSPDAGATWTEILLDVYETPVFWHVNMLPNGEEYLVRVVARSSLGLVAEDVSDSVFSITDYTLIQLAGVSGVIVLVIVLYALHRKKMI